MKILLVRREWKRKLFQARRALGGFLLLLAGEEALERPGSFLLVGFDAFPQEHLADLGNTSLLDGRDFVELAF